MSVHLAIACKSFDFESLESVDSVYHGFKYRESTLNVLNHLFLFIMA